MDRFLKASRCLGLLLLALPAGGCLPDLDAPGAPHATLGQMDFSGVDLLSRAYALDGQWRFEWNQLHETPGTESPVFIEVPRPWNSFGYVNTGFATYHLRLTGLPPTARLALRIGDLNTAYRLLVDGQTIHAVGRVGTEPESSRSTFRPDVIALPPGAGHLITLQISNFTHRKAGLDGSILIGSERDLRAGQELDVGRTLLLFGIFLITGIHYLTVFILRRRELAPLFFSLFCLALATRMLVTGEYLLARVLPHFATIMRLEYLTLVFSTAIFALFLNATFPREYRRFLSRPIALGAAIMGGLILFTEPLFFTELLGVDFLLALTTMLSGFVCVAIASMRHRPGALTMLAGGGMFSLTVVADMLGHDYVLDLPNLLKNPTQYGLIILILAQSTVLARRSASAFRTAETLTAELERRVAERTRALEESNREVRETSRMYRNLVETSVNLIWAIDTEGIITFVNAAGKQIYGYEPQEVIGQHFARYVDPERLENDSRMVRRVLAGETIFNYETVHRHRNGKRIFLMFNALAARDDSGAVTGASGTAVDITQQKNMLDELRVSRDLAEQSSRAKSEFLATMSHEIRTPLNSLLGSVDLLQETKLDQHQTDLLSVIERSGRRLLNEISDILDLSRVESGKLELEITTFNLHELLEEMRAMFAQHASSAGLELHVLIKTGVPQWIEGDAHRLQQVLSNLLGNALKFTEHGSVELIAECETDREDRVRIAFEVRDTGIGIPPDRLESIFDSFSQADSSTTRRFGGTGLGLAICRRLVRLMGGEILVSSAEGEGSRFRFTANLKKAAPSEPGLERAARVAAPSSAPMHILVAEDNADNVYLIQAYLRNSSITADFAENGAIAIKRAHEKDYDLILMDIQMPVMDGYTAVRLLREWEQESGREPTPILALSANASAEDREQSLAAGCDEHLSKPIKKHRLLEAIREYARHRN